MSNPIHLAVLDDEPEIAQMLAAYFTGHGFGVIWIEVLDAEAQAVEAQLREARGTPSIHGARVDLDGLLAFRRKLEGLPQSRDQALQASAVSTPRTTGPGWLGSPASKYPA